MTLNMDQGSFIISEMFPAPCSILNEKWLLGWESNPREQAYETCLNPILRSVMVLPAGISPASPTLEVSRSVIELRERSAFAEGFGVTWNDGG